MNDKTFFAVQLEDLSAQITLAKGKTDQTQRRSIIRASFAIVEGFLHFLKDIILDDLHLNPGHHSAGEIAMLREETYTVNRAGKVQVQQKFIPTDANLRFTIEMWCRGTNRGGIDVNGPGWQAFTLSLAVRNRLAHPKQTNDLVVTDAEMKQFYKGMLWFMRTMQEKLQEA